MGSQFGIQPEKKHRHTAAPPSGPIRIPVCIVRSTRQKSVYLSSKQENSHSSVFNSGASFVWHSGIPVLRSLQPDPEKHRPFHKVLRTLPRKCKENGTERPKPSNPGETAALVKAFLILGFCPEKELEPRSLFQQTARTQMILLDILEIKIRTYLQVGASRLVANDNPLRVKLERGNRPHLVYSTFHCLL